MYRPPVPRVEMATVAGRPRDDVPALSERQRELLGHLAAGRSVRQTAAAMSVSTNTVRTHVRRLVVKFGADERHDAVRPGPPAPAALTAVLMKLVG